MRTASSIAEELATQTERLVEVGNKTAQAIRTLALLLEQLDPKRKKRDRYRRRYERVGRARRRGHHVRHA